jgi:oligopeptide/dipeptide ABC transporter ATP-binding protein
MPETDTGFVMVPILEVRGLQKSFGTGLLQKGRNVHALAGIDLTVEQGDTVGLVGESSCGKTTLARCALLLLMPDAGSVFFDGCDLLRLAPAELRARRREFQMVFQDPFGSLDPRMRVREILAEPFEVHRQSGGPSREERALELLDEVALDRSLADRRPAELSGGQQQRVAIARALALKPRLLVADELVSALDASVRAQILNLLGDLRQRLGLTLILISHSLPTVQYLCTRVAVMYLGRIVEEAPAAEFFRGPMHPYSQALLESIPVLNPEQGSKRPVLVGDVPSPAAPPPGCPFHPRCPKVFARCREERPALRLGQTGKAACFLYTEGRELSYKCDKSLEGGFHG